MGSNPTLGRYFSTQVYLNGDEDGIDTGAFKKPVKSETAAEL